jgi:hypothetical protein
MIFWCSWGSVPLQYIQGLFYSKFFQELAPVLFYSSYGKTAITLQKAEALEIYAYLVSQDSHCYEVTIMARHK